MKYSLALALAPLALAGSIRRARDVSVEARSDHLVEGMKGWGITEHSKTEIVIIWANPGAGHETQTYNSKVTVTETITAPMDHATVVPGADGATHTVDPGMTTAIPCAAATHTVTVGGPAGLVFVPDHLPNVPVGDTVIFEFLSKNHTVTQSPFDDPCSPLEGGMDTGFQANPDNSIVPAPQVAMQVMDSKPLWFYCKQGNHCGAGMVFSINPTAEKTQAKFKEIAIAKYGDGKDAPIVGGDPIAPPPAENPPVESPPADKPADKPATDKPATPAPAPEENVGVVPGKGVVGEDGSCHCVVQCGASAFPANEYQGLNSWGGMPGGLPKPAYVS